MSDPDSPFAESRPMFRGIPVVLGERSTIQDWHDFRDLWERAWRKEFLASPSDLAIDAELLAWAKRKATEPFEWCHDHVRCAFCGQQQALMWNGAMETFHSDTCLAVRANKP